MPGSNALPEDPMARFRLDGKGAVVTGGCGVLGAHFCRALAAQGAAVAVLDLNQDAAEALAQQLAADHGVAVYGAACDVADPNAVSQTVEEAAARLGSLDVLVNNAATKTSDWADFFEPFESYSLATWREVMAVNLDGAFLMAQAVGKRMAASGRGGSIVQLSSIYGLVGPDNRIYEGSSLEGMPINTPAPYAASKAALVGLTRYLATYWGGQGVRVNAIAPGGVESGQNETFVTRYSSRTPMGRMGRVEEIVSALLYLASDASSYVTGQTLAVDGGWTAW